MANPEHLAWLNEGVEAWNRRWKGLHEKGVSADLEEADLFEANLAGADLREADLGWAVLSKADLRGADLEGANLQGAHLQDAELAGANLRGATLFQAVLVLADLDGADLRGADLVQANLTYAHLRGADLRKAKLEETNLLGADLGEAKLVGAILEHAALTGADLRGADLTGCHVYGTSAWDVRLDEHTKQNNLIISQWGHLEVSVDNLEIAQFVYLLFNNDKLRAVIDAMTTKAVLILGRFTKERLAVLEAVRDRLRRLGYLPILFDFKKSDNQSVVDTVATLAGLARFIVADLTDAKAVDQELQLILPQVKVPVQPLPLVGAEPPTGMLEALLRKHNDVLLPIHLYRNADRLFAALPKKVVAPAEDRLGELKLREARYLYQQPTRKRRKKK